MFEGVFLYVPQCSLPYTSEVLNCPGDLVSLPTFSISEVVIFGIDILVSVLPFTLPVILTGISVASILYLLRCKP